MFRLVYVDPNPARLAPEVLASLADLPAGVAVGLAYNRDEALAQARQCDMMVVSAAWPDDGALEIVRAVAQVEPRVSILVKDLAEAHQNPQSFLDAGATGWTL